MKLQHTDYGTLLIVLLSIASILYFSCALRDPIEPPDTSTWEYSDTQADVLH